MPTVVLQFCKKLSHSALERIQRYSCFSVKRLQIANEPRLLLMIITLYFTKIAK